MEGTCRSFIATLVALMRSRRKIKSRVLSDIPWLSESGSSGRMGIARISWFCSSTRAKTINLISLFSLEIGLSWKGNKLWGSWTKSGWWNIGSNMKTRPINVFTSVLTGLQDNSDSNSSFWIEKMTIKLSMKSLNHVIIGTILNYLHLWAFRGLASIKDGWLSQSGISWTLVNNWDLAFVTRDTAFMAWDSTHPSRLIIFHQLPDCFLKLPYLLNIDLVHILPFDLLFVLKTS